MSGVQGFVNQGGKSSEHQTSRVAQERSAHRNQMKVPIRPTRVNQTPPRARSAHEYVNHGSSMPIQRYPADRFYDSTMDSEFDETRSDLTLGKGDVQYQETEDNDTVHQDLGVDGNAQLSSFYQHAKAVNEQPAIHSISGRFHKIANANNHAQSQPYTARQGQLQNVHRTGDQPGEEVDHAAGRFVEDNGDSFEEGSGDEYEESVSNGGSAKRSMHGRNINDGPESDTPVASQSRPSKTEVQANASISSDYTIEELQGIPYSQLQAEPWETVPNAPAFIFPQTLQDVNSKLEDKIDFYSQKAFDQSKNAKHGDIEGEEPYVAQAKFYANLSAADWDQAGDYLIGKFSEIMQKLKQAKQEKRRVMEAFEAEIAAREEKVRNEALGIQKKLGDMESNGKELLGGNLERDRERQAAYFVNEMSCYKMCG